MIARLLIFVPLTLLMFVITCFWFSSYNDFPLFFGGCTLVGIYAIWYSLRYQVRFKLADHFLVFESPLHKARYVDLKALTDWRELGFNIRGQRRKTVILLFKSDEKVVVDNSEYKGEFEELLRYLFQEHQDKKLD